MAQRARQATMIARRWRRLLHSVIRDIACGKSWKIKLFQKPVGRIAKGSFIDHVFMQSFCSLRRHLGKSFSMLFITDLNMALLVERSLTAAIWYISSASVMLECWQNLSKLTNQRVYQILVYLNDLLLSLPTALQAFSRFLSAHSLNFFTRCFLHCALTNWTLGRG